VRHRFLTVPVCAHQVWELKQDWRRGADYFESVLLDYDCTSNWGNWHAAAALSGGRINRSEDSHVRMHMQKDGRKLPVNTQSRTYESHLQDTIGPTRSEEG
jgi:hypothetical protein